jgi:hypothetical protein
MQHRLKQTAGFGLGCCEAGRAADSAVKGVVAWIRIKIG